MHARGTRFRCVSLAALGSLQNALEVVGTKGEVDIIVVHAPFVRKFLGRCLVSCICRLGPQPSQTPSILKGGLSSRSSAKINW